MLVTRNLQHEHPLIIMCLYESPHFGSFVWQHPLTIDKYTPYPSSPVSTPFSSLYFPYTKEIWLPDGPVNVGSFSGSLRSGVSLIYVVHRPKARNLRFEVPLNPNRILRGAGSFANGHASWLHTCCQS